MAVATEENYSARNIEAAQLEQIPVDSIAASSLNPRWWFAQESLEELAASIRAHGILEPLVVRPVTPAGARGFETPFIEIELSSGRPRYKYKFELIAGERRWRAAKLAGLSTVPAVIRHDVKDDGQALQLMLVENLHRTDLNPIEEAQGYKRLQELGMRQKEIADQVHKNQPAIAKRLMLLDLPVDVQERIRKGELTAAHGVELASYKSSPDFVSALAEKAVEKSWNSHQVKKWDERDAWDLERAGAIQSLDHEPFTDECKTRCPHEAYRKGSYSYIWCLKPDCYKQKKGEYEAVQQAKVQQLIVQAQAKGETLPKLNDLPMDSYRTIYSTTKFPGDCLGRLCDRIGKAVDRLGEIREICPDTKCWQRNERRDSLAKSKSDRARYKLLLQEIPDAVDGIQTIGSRELAIIAAEALRNKSSEIRQEIFNRYGQPEVAKAFDGYSSNWHEALAGLTPLEIVKATLEILLLDEIKTRYKTKSSNSSVWTDWYLTSSSAEAAP